MTYLDDLRRLGFEPSGNEVEDNARLNKIFNATAPANIDVTILVKNKPKTITLQDGYCRPAMYILLIIKSNL